MSYVCPNGHPVELVLMVACEADGCMAQVAYEPIAHGMSLFERIAEHRAAVAGNARPADLRLWELIGP